jgi:hypothetical protein
MEFNKFVGIYQPKGEENKLTMAEGLPLTEMTILREHILLSCESKTIKYKVLYFNTLHPWASDLFYRNRHNLQVFQQVLVVD